MILPSDLTGRQFKSLLREWQKRLRLQDWKIDLIISGELDGACGLTSRTSWEYKTSRIQVSTIEQMIRNGVDPKEMDQEAVLVHELLHLMHWPIETGGSDSTEAKIMENMVEMTAQALVALKREVLAARAKNKPKTKRA